MKPSAILTTVQIFHEPVIHALIDAGWRTFVTYDQPWPQHMRDHLAAAGGTLLVLDYFCPDEEKDAIARACGERAGKILEAFRTRSVDAEFLMHDAAALEDLLSKRLDVNLAECEILVRCCEYLSEQYDVAAVVVSEDIRRWNRAVLDWAKSHLIPTFHVTHGAGFGRGYTIYEEIHADYVLLAGARAAEAYLDCGIARERLVVVGHPGWDVYGKLVPNQDRIRREIRTALALPAEMPIVLFGTTSFQPATAQVDYQVRDRTLETFFLACVELRNRGVRFVPLVKDRPYYGQTGIDTVKTIAAQCGVDDVQYAEGRPEKLICAADVVVACDSNLSVEAMIAGVPTVNVWTVQSWLTGPYFDGSDGVEQIAYGEPKKLASSLARLLSDEAHRSGVVSRQREVVATTIYHSPAGSARECARAILERLHVPDQAMIARMRLPVPLAETIAGLDTDPHVSVLHSRLVLGRALTGLKTESVSCRGFEPAFIASFAPSGDSGASSSDVIIIADLAEELRQDPAALRRLRETLNEGGRIVAAARNLRNLSEVLRLLAASSWMFSGIPSGYVRPQVVGLFEEQGYAIERLFCVEDPRVASLDAALQGTCDVVTERVVIRRTTPEERSELAIHSYVVVAMPA